MECWINMLDQHVERTFHTNFGVGVNSAIVDSFACQTCGYNMLVQHSIVNLHLKEEKKITENFKRDDQGCFRF